MTAFEIKNTPVGTKVYWIEHDHMNKNGEPVLECDEIVEQELDRAGWIDLKYRTINAARIALTEKEALENDIAENISMATYYEEYDSIPTRQVLKLLALERELSEKRLKELANDIS